MKPFVKEYKNDEQLQNDVRVLKDKGVSKENIYILSHDDDRTKRVAGNAGANTVGIQEMDFGNAVGNLFNKKGDELRNKLNDMGFSQAEAEKYEEDMDQGNVLLMVENSPEAATYLV
ncbi:general stress protein [Virgibacillus halophilus]|uniref:general stress protein n=1 Tax=Tigheibacillus halophilus TaxID=361280 RepID=UPI00363B4EB2